MKHSELRHQPRHVNPRIQVIAKINEVDWNKVKEESNIGSRFDFSV